jgi:hypothetical protein
LQEDYEWHFFSPLSKLLGKKKKPQPFTKLGIRLGQRKEVALCKYPKM